MTNLVVLSYGSQKEYRRAVLAVLSFFSFYDVLPPLPEVQVIIYTDHSDYFEQFLADVPVRYVILTPEQQTAMMGAIEYRHRIKAVVVGNTLAGYPEANLLFFDSDTFFVKHPKPLLESIQPGLSVMHTVEFTFNDIAYQPLPHGKTVADFVRMMEHEAFHTTHGTEHFSGTQQCWNSGVLGLAPSVAAYLPDIYQLIDHLYIHSHWHITEQIAFSLVLQTRDQIQPAIDYVYHYWEGDKKLAADALLTRALDANFAALSHHEKLVQVRQLVKRLPTAIPAYLNTHAEIGLKQAAITAFNADDFWSAYRAAAIYLLKVPSDRKFLRDVLYHTKRRLTLHR